jgi:hypothetical protein
MENSTKPTIVSFIIRFVQDQPVKDTAVRPYRGFIRHIQTDEEVQFSHWEDAEFFIQQFVPIDKGLKQIGTK